MKEYGHTFMHTYMHAVPCLRSQPYAAMHAIDTDMHTRGEQHVQSICFLGAFGWLLEPFAALAASQTL